MEQWRRERAEGLNRKYRSVIRRDDASRIIIPCVLFTRRQTCRGLPCFVSHVCRPSGNVINTRTGGKREKRRVGFPSSSPYLRHNSSGCAFTRHRYVVRNRVLIEPPAPRESI